MPRWSGFGFCMCVWGGYGNGYVFVISKRRLLFPVTTNSVQSALRTTDINAEDETGNTPVVVAAKVVLLLLLLRWWWW